MIKLAALTIFLAFLIGVGIFAFQYRKNDPLIPFLADDAPINGEVNFNGVAPANSSFVIQARPSGGGNFNTVISNLAPMDLVNWDWEDAKSGVNYDVRVQLVSKGEVLATSQTLTVTAPATSEVLTVNYGAPTQTPATISGLIDLNGYIPAGATITVQQQQVGGANFSSTSAAVPAVDGSTWSWSSALSGSSYNIKAVLTSNGVVIGESQPLSVTAPAASETLTINSSATPPQNATNSQAAQTNSGPNLSSGISGSVNFNGVAPQNSSIVILAAANGSGNYQVVANGISVANGSQWSFSNAQAGTTYEMMAVLKQTNSNGTQTDVSTSQSLIVAAPAANEVFTLNSNISLPGPTGQVTVNCQTKNNANNTWSAQISYPTQTGANGYWFQLGSTNGGSDIVNVVQNPMGTSQIVNATLNDSVTYYAHYAYTYTSNPNFQSGFSSFSGTSNIICP